jgi:hypothetical protein
MFVIFSGIDDEPVDATIPCEYCNAQIGIHEWERHTVEK